MLDKIKKWLGAGGEGGESGESGKSAPAPIAVETEARWVDASEELGDFSRIKATGKVWVEWRKGAGACVITYAQAEDGQGKPVLSLEGSTLVVEQQPGALHPARVKVSSKSLDGFDCQGDASGAAQGLDAEIFEGRLENGSRLLLSGRAVAAKLWIAGSGSLDADQLEAHAVFAKATGSGLLEARASAVAEAIIGSGGEIVIKGDPGVAKIERVGDGRAKIGSKVGQVEEENAGGIFDHMPLPRK
jgi:hypothetical protein